MIWAKSINWALMSSSILLTFEFERRHPVFPVLFASSVVSRMCSSSIICTYLTGSVEELVLIYLLHFEFFLRVMGMR